MSEKMFAVDIRYSAINSRKHSAHSTDFGGHDDGKTLNTAAFQAAIQNLSHYAKDGGAHLIVPPGRWLTGSFNRTSYFSLFIQSGAFLQASTNESDYHVMDPLPSYGVGRDGRGGRRFSSLIGGYNRTDVVITGDEGPINAQGDVWWEKFRNKKLKNTRPYLIEFMYSNQIQISNLVLVQFPSWFIHTDYCSDPKALPEVDGINYKNVVAKDVTMAGDMSGIDGDPFTRFCMSVTIGLSRKPEKWQWHCSNIFGISSNVTPKPCDLRKICCGIPHISQYG